MGRKITFIVLIATLSFGTIPGVVVERSNTEAKNRVKIFALGGNSFSSPNLSLSADSRVSEEESSYLARLKKGEDKENDFHFLSFAKGYYPESLSETTHNPRAPPRTA